MANATSITRLTCVHDAEIRICREGRKVWLATNTRDEQLGLHFTHQEAFLNFVQQCNLVATAIQAERATEEVEHG